LDSAQEELLNDMSILHTFATKMYSQPVSLPVHFAIEGRHFALVSRDHVRPLHWIHGIGLTLFSDQAGANVMSR